MVIALAQRKRKLIAHLEIVLEGVSNNHLVLQYVRNVLLTGAQTQSVPQIFGPHAAHPRPEIRHAFIGGHELIVSASCVVVVTARAQLGKRRNWAKIGSLSSMGEKFGKGGKQAAGLQLKPALRKKVVMTFSRFEEVPRGAHAAFSA